MKNYYYAVAVGREIGIYNSWDECEQMVKGYKGAIFKKFNNITDAQDFILVHSNYTQDKPKNR